MLCKKLTKLIRPNQVRSSAVVSANWSLPIPHAIEIDIPIRVLRVNLSAWDLEGRREKIEARSQAA